MLPDERLDAAIDYIEKSRADLADGKLVVLEGFQNEVIAIHSAISKLPTNEAKGFKLKVEKLISGLKTLEQELVQQQHKVQQEMFALNRRQKALKSYQTINHSGGNDGN